METQTGTQGVLNEEPIRTFGYSEKETKIYQFGAVFFIIVDLIALVVLGTIVGGFMGAILMMVKGGSNKNLKVVKAYPQYIIVQLQAVSPQVFIKYKDITEIESAEKNVKIHYKNENGKDKRIKIPQHVLPKEDLRELFQFLETKINA